MDGQLTVLVSEGSSLSARQIVTALGMAGHRIELCDPNPLCLARFSRFVARFHKCPPFAQQPEAYLRFVLDLCRSRSIDVVFPAHDQAYLFARAIDDFPSSVAVPVPSFSAIAAIISKTGFALTAAALSLPQPNTLIAYSEDELRSCVRLPCFIKAAYATASRGVWRVTTAEAIDTACAALSRQEAWRDGVVIQEAVGGRLERIQGVFAHGHLVAAHGYAQVVEGFSGGDLLKESLDRPSARDALLLLGKLLAWHGALSLDYIWDQQNRPLLIDANTRLVEPMNGVFAGINLADATVRVALGLPCITTIGKPGVRSHMAIQAILLAAADKRQPHRKLLKQGFDLLRGGGQFLRSREELTPASIDLPSVAAPLALAARTFVAPGATRTIAGPRYDTYALSRLVRDLAARRPLPHALLSQAAWRGDRTDCKQSWPFPSGPARQSLTRQHQ